MKLLIASDLHGSLYYCNRLIEVFAKENADKILFLGDILYHGPRNDLPKDYSPKDVASILNELKSNILCVKGNCDSDVDQCMLQFPIMAEYCLVMLKNNIIYATHGDKYNKENIPAINTGDILLFGHTHVPEYSEKNGIIFMNPGSLSIPKENSSNSYLVYEDGLFLFKQLNDCKVFNTYEYNS